MKIFAGPKTAPTWLEAERARFEVRMEAGKPPEICIYGYIGDDYWDESVMSEQKFLNALKQVPSGSDLNIRINSEGGSVKVGLGLYNAIRRWSGKTTVYIDGCAFSIASIIPLAADRVVSPKSCFWMIHDPWSFTGGNAEDHRRSIEMLEASAETMAAIYAEATGKSRKEMREAMKAETWLTGEEAVSYGLADESPDDDVVVKAQQLIDRFHPPDRLVAMMRSRAIPTPNPPPTSAGQNPQADIMQKAKILALLKQHGKPLADDAKEESILAALSDLVAAGKIKQDEADVLKKPDANDQQMLINAGEWTKIQAQLQTEKEARIRQEFRALALDRPYLQESEWLPKLMVDETIKAQLAAMPVMPHGRPITLPVQNNGNSIIEAYRKFKPGQERLSFAMENWHGLEEAHESSRIEQLSALSVQEQLRRLHSPRAANSYSATLVTDRLADSFITTLGVKLAPFRAFSREFGTDRLKPKATVQVRKVTATSAVQTNPTNFETGDTTTTPVSVTVDQISKSFHVTNDELNKGHQLMQAAGKNAQTFANALSDLWTALLLVANYGATTAIGSAANFDALDLAPIYALAKNFGTKNLILDGGHLAYLLPTDKFKFKLGEEGAYGFDLIGEQNRWTNAVANAVGFVCDPSAIAICSGLPVDLPSSEFIELGVVEIPSLGLTVQVCHWFSRGGRVHWMSYDVMFGAQAGDTTAGEVLVTS